MGQAQTLMPRVVQPESADFLFALACDCDSILVARPNYGARRWRVFANFEGVRKTWQLAPGCDVSFSWRLEF